MSDEEQVTAQLLRLAGTPPDPSVERMARARESVRRAWSAARRRRTNRRVATFVLLATAASVMAAVLIHRAPPAVVPPSLRMLATGERVQGQPFIIHPHEPAGSPQPLSASMSIHAGDVIQTDRVSRAGLRAAGGSSVRIDRDSRIRFVEMDIVEVEAGAVYVATAQGAPGFEVRTALGWMRDVGTQFEVRLEGPSLRVRVRTGTVEIRRGSAVHTTTAGTEAIVTRSGVAVERLAPYGAVWEWTTSIAPVFPFEGQSLGMFLQRVSLEEGWTIEYADHDIAKIAQRVILHGSVDGLSAEEAVGVAVATSGLQYRLRDGELLVSRSTPAR